MARSSVILCLILFLAACGGDSPASVAGETASTTTPAAGRCPSGEITRQGDGADYLNLAGSHQRALEGVIPDGRPTFLGPASDAIPEDLMVGLEYTGCAALGPPSNFEEMAWSNGLGLLLVSWHEWPRVADPSMAPFGGTSRQAGVVQVSHMETGTEESRMRVVRLFDGLKLVAVSTYGLTTMSIEQVEDVAWAVYDGLPMNMEGGATSGVTVSEVLDGVRSDAVTVSEAEGIMDVSPFTARTGAAHTSYSAVIDGTNVLLYDFGIPQVAERAAGMISPDGFSLAHQPYDWQGTPHFWQLDRVILLYEGGSESFLDLLIEEFGTPFAGGIPVE